MVLVAGLIGLFLGLLLNLVIAQQVGLGSNEQHLPERRPRLWLPIIGAARRQAWLDLTVELATSLMAAVLVYRYGLSLRSLFLFGASLILIDTAAVDFKIRMIDTLVLIIATLAAFALAPVNELSWLLSLIGTLVAGGIFIFFFVLAKILFPGHAAPFGLGDVYLGAFIGALVGFLDLPPALFYGMALAGLVSCGLLVLRATGRQIPTYIAYGTYLCVGALLFLATGGPPG